MSYTVEQLYQLSTAMYCTDNDDSGHACASKVFTFQEVLAPIQCKLTMYKQKEFIGLNLPVSTFCPQAFDTADRRNIGNKLKT